MPFLGLILSLSLSFFLINLYLKTNGFLDDILERGNVDVRLSEQL